MAHFGSGVEYAIHCLLYLVGREGAAMPSSRDLAVFQGVSMSYLAKLFSQLEKAGIVTAAEGVRGGYRLARPADAITVLDVADAIEGKKPLFDCREIRATCVLFGSTPPAWATGGVCSIHAVMLDAERRMRETLRARTLADLAGAVDRKMPGEFRSDVKAWFDGRAEGRLRAPANGRRGAGSDGRGKTGSSDNEGGST